MTCPQSTLARPEVRLGLFGAALVVGEWLGLSTGGWAVAWPCAGLLALLVAAFGFSRRWRFWPTAFALLLGLALAMRATAVQHGALTAIALDNGRFERDVTVEDEPHVGSPGLSGMRWVSFPSSFPGGMLSVLFSQPSACAVPQIGETWRCAGWLERRAEDDRRPRRLWVKGGGAYAECVRKPSPFALAPLLARARRNLSRRVGIGLEDRLPAAELNRAMLLGVKKAMPSEMRETFLKSGTIHVFAISGLHVMVVAQLLAYVLVVLLFPVRWAGVVLLPVLWLYVMLIGSPPSALRAVAMASVYYAAPLFWRRPDSLTAWEVTLIAFALVDPVGLFGVGSMLSFTVMLGILLFLRWAKPFMVMHHRGSGEAERGRPLAGLVALFGVPFAAWASGVPIAAHVFSRITPGGLLANLAMVPLAWASVMTSALGVLTSFLSERLAAHVNNLAALFTETMAGVSWVVARLPGADVEIVPWPLPLCLAWYAGFVLLFAWVRMVWSRRRGAMA